MGPGPDERAAGTTMAPALVVGVDVGGTHLKAGLVTPDGTVLARLRRDSVGDSADTVLEAVAVVVDDLRDAAGDARVIGVGVGAAGFVDHDAGTVAFAPHLPWRDEPLRERLAERIDLPVVLDNDANLAAWAEHRFGAGRGEPDLVMITLGTGIGGAHVVDGELVRGRHGLAGEYGHVPFVPDGRPCECGLRGCWEQYVSGAVLVRELRSVAGGAGGDGQGDGIRGALDGASVDGTRGGQDHLIRGEDVTLAALEGDPLAVHVLGLVGRRLGLGMASLAAALDPGCFVVGGGVVAAGDLLLRPAREALAERLPGRGHRPVPPVRAALLGNEAGLVGAADLARHELTDGCGDRGDLVSSG